MGRFFRADGSVERRFEPHNVPVIYWPKLRFVPKGKPAWRASLAIEAPERDRMFKTAYGVGDRRRGCGAAGAGGVIGKIQAWLAALGVALAAILGAWRRGRSAGKADAQGRQDKAYRDTREKIDAVEDPIGVSDAELRERLRKHAGL